MIMSILSFVVGERLTASSAVSFQISARIREAFFWLVIILDPL